MESESEESERFHFFRVHLRLCCLIDPVKTVRVGSKAEDPTNHRARNRTLSLVYSFASACDSDNAVFT